MARAGHDDHYDHNDHNDLLKTGQHETCLNVRRGVLVVVVVVFALGSAYKKFQ